jgi:hypothetical protein
MSTSAAAGNGAAAAAGKGASMAGGSAPAPSGPFSCGPTSTKSPAELYAAAATAFLPKDDKNVAPCAFGPCHNTNKMIAKLAFAPGGSLVDAVVNKPACEAPNLKLVDPSGGDKALANSYLYLKLAAPVDGSANLVPDPAWGSPMNCGQPMDFGARMPVGSGEMGVGDEKLAIMKEWICAGAPGPM